jgi:hypothetical protein
VFVKLAYTLYIARERDMDQYTTLLSSVYASPSVDIALYAGRSTMPQVNLHPLLTNTFNFNYTITYINFQTLVFFIAIFCTTVWPLVCFGCLLCLSRQRVCAAIYLFLLAASAFSAFIFSFACCADIF